MKVFVPKNDKYGSATIVAENLEEAEKLLLELEKDPYLLQQGLKEIDLSQKGVPSYFAT